MLIYDFFFLINGHLRDIDTNQKVDGNILLVNNF